MKKNKTFTKTGYKVGKIKKNSIIEIVRKKSNSSYHYFENEKLDIIDDSKSFFTAKSRKTGLVTAISKADIHTNKINCKVVG